MVSTVPRRHIHDHQGVSKRHIHVGWDAPAGELFRPIYFNNTSMEATIDLLQTQENNCDLDADTGHISIGVKILHTMSHKVLTRAEEYVK
jgi:hypothetical protein